MLNLMVNFMVVLGFIFPQPIAPESTTAVEEDRTQLLDKEPTSEVEMPTESESQEVKTEVATSVFTSCDSDSVGISTSDVGSLSKSCVLSSSTAVVLSGAIGCGKIKPRTTMKFTIRFNIFHLNLNGFCTCIL